MASKTKFLSLSSAQADQACPRASLDPGMDNRHKANIGELESVAESATINASDNASENATENATSTEKTPEKTGSLGMERLFKWVKPHLDS